MMHSAVASRPADLAMLFPCVRPRPHPCFRRLRQPPPSSSRKQGSVHLLCVPCAAYRPLGCCQKHPPAPQPRPHARMARPLERRAATPGRRPLHWSWHPSEQDSYRADAKPLTSRKVAKVAQLGQLQRAAESAEMQTRRNEHAGDAVGSAAAQQRMQAVWRRGRRGLPGVAGVVAWLQRRQRRMGLLLVRESGSAVARRALTPQQAISWVVRRPLAHA